MKQVNPVIARAIELTPGQTQAALAEASGLSQQYISKLFESKRTPSVDAAIKISRATGGAVKIGEILPSIVGAVEEELARRQPASAEAAA